MKVAINGFGRIGALVLRQGIREKSIEWVVNHPKGIESAALVFKYDSVHGKWPGSVEMAGNSLVIDARKVRVISERKKPEELPWKELGVDVVIESTGVFRKQADVEGHIRAGAKKAVISAPGKDEGIPSIVLGVNGEKANGKETVIDNASCTTNCLMPVLKVLNDNFGIKKAFMTTIHGYTSDQNLVDGTHEKDARRARAAALNIIPTSTGASSAAAKVIPALKGRVEGKAVRVPVPAGSLVDLTVIVERETSVEGVNAAMRKAAGGALKGILEYTEEPIVSTDVLGNTHSSIFDAEQTKVVGGTFVQVVSWYDNETGYSQRIVDLVKSLKL